MKKTSIAAVAALTVACLAGCRFDGVNTLPLPGPSTSGESYTVRIELRDAQNLVGNSIVKADNVTVGSVRSIAVEAGVAVVTAHLDDSVSIPADSTAQLAQTSVLGAQYLELTTPVDAAPEPPLVDGDVLTLGSTSEYPATEDVLAALSLVLNGSGLEQIRTISAELNNAAGGREDQLNKAVVELKTFVGGLDDQRQNIVRAIDSLGRFSGALASRNDTIERGIDSIGPALQVLDEQRVQLTTMLDRIGHFGDQAAGVLDASSDDLSSTLQSLAPTLAKLEESGSDLSGALLVGLTFPFPVSVADRGLRGDYENLFLTLDLSAEAIQNKVLGSIPADELARSLLPRQAADPLRVPLAGAPLPGGTP